MGKQNTDFWAPRKCFIVPPKEADLAANLLLQAVDAYNANDFQTTKEKIIEADFPVLEEWRYKVSGAYNQEIHRIRNIDNTPPIIPEEKRPKPRMPSAKTQKLLIERDGYRCLYCNIQLIVPEIFKKLKTTFPDEARWGRSNIDRHGALNVFWLTFDHVIPHSRGGGNEIENCVVSCQTCNCGKSENLLEEIGLIDPRTHTYPTSSWNGLTHMK